MNGYTNLCAVPMGTFFDFPKIRCRSVSGPEGLMVSRGQMAPVPPTISPRQPRRRSLRRQQTAETGPGGRGRPEVRLSGPAQQSGAGWRERADGTAGPGWEKLEFGLVANGLFRAEIVIGSRLG